MRVPTAEYHGCRISSLTVRDLSHITDGVFLRTTGVTTLTGEAYVNRRKAKIIAGYEMELKLAYEGEIKVDGEAGAYSRPLLSST